MRNEGWETKVLKRFFVVFSVYSERSFVHFIINVFINFSVTFGVFFCFSKKLRSIAFFPCFFSTSVYFVLHPSVVEWRRVSHFLHYTKIEWWFWYFIASTDFFFFNSALLFHPCSKERVYLCHTKAENF